ncbi:hypothetical protein G210_4067 [Candida maltosa Xu316]|uniref:Uncharacterized protein n=1 Tax=Candida maltosa (strain Xu316) TaxID=1245528 RepID=M3JSF0_CANMX|nr:hypothetical protein G210_4067 [Candida maltosa Xu316]
MEPINIIELSDDEEECHNLPTQTTQSNVIELSDTDEDIPNNSISTQNDDFNLGSEKILTQSMVNNFHRSSFKSSFKLTTSSVPPSEEDDDVIILSSGKGEEEEDQSHDTTDIKDLFNMVPKKSKQLPSSPILPSSQRNENDSIVDSTFNFSAENIKPRIPENIQPRKPEKLDTEMPGFVRWLSSDDEGEEEDLIVSTSQPTIEPSLSQPIAQPAKRSHTIQELPSNPQPVKKAKRSKTTDVVTHLPRIGDFHYTQKDLKEANKVTRKKEEIYAEMELHITKDVFSLFQELSSDFQSRILPANYGPPIIFWKRNVTAIYDKERDIFIPCHPTKILEKTFVLYYLAADFVTKLDNGDLKADVLAASQEALSITPNEYHIIIMVEGYDQLLWKIKSFEQRKFKNQVLQGLNSQEQSRRRNTDAEMAKYPSSNQIEFLVNRTQIDLKVNIFTIRGRPESVM